ncbi:basic blue protein isoform X2 [Vigna radiata var. radiata]|uniref:Basic blue protein isoform X2 n=1 Tax=Vigna radiata var. radiata TaxID=3916 RepID=A0A3Q0F7B1_VIGRR|nr:basic blue protein isoform X2 [Vigna radiata var. radiata]
MALGRGSALVLSLSLCFFLLHSHMAHAATTYTVGDRNGWTFNTVSWPKGKRFKAGDTLGLGIMVATLQKGRKCILQERIGSNLLRDRTSSSATLRVTVNLG